MELNLFLSKGMQVLFERYQVPKEKQQRILYFLWRNGFSSGFDISQIKKDLESFRTNRYYLDESNLFQSACFVCDIEYAKFLLNIGMNINCLDAKQRNALHVVCVG